MQNILYGGVSDVGYQRTINEDYINLVELDDDTLFAIVVDGAGSFNSEYQPAIIVTLEITNAIKRVFEKDKELFLNNTGLFLNEAILNANRVLGAFKLGNEEMYSGFASALTCCVVCKSGRITFAHAGNTRLYLLRPMSDGATIKQLTKDHTKIQHLVDEGVIDEITYYQHPDRMVLYSGLGVVSEPTIQTFSGNIKTNDILLITTDGIHNAIRKEAMADIVYQSNDCKLAADMLIKGAKSLQNIDNMSAIVIWNKGEQ